MESIGVKMEMERELKGLSIADVARDTKINPSYLIALENENYDELPGEAYIKAFLRSYSKYLGLDPEEIIQKYDYNNAVKADLGQPQTFEERKPINWRSLAIGALGVVLAVLLLWLATSLFLRSRKTETLSREAPPKPTPAAPSQNQQSQSPPGVDNQIEFEDNFIYLAATASEKVWVSVSADGKPVEPATGIIMDKGDVRIWRARARLEVDTGNAGGLELEFNGRPVGTLGYSGEVVHGMVFTKSQIKIR